MGMHSTKFGGIERFLLQLMKNNPNDKFYFAYNSFPDSSEFTNKIKEKGGVIIVLNTTGFNIIKNLFLFTRLCFKLKPNVIHFHFEFSYLIYAPIAKILGIKRIIKTQHSCLTNKNGEQITSMKQFSIRYKICTLYGLLYRVFDYIVFVSEYTKKQFINIYGNSPHLKQVYLGTSPIPTLTSSEKEIVRQELKIADGQIVITTTLFAQWIKGVDVLINAIPLIKNKNIVVVIIGMDEQLPFTKEMHTLSKSLGIAHYFRWTGITDHVYRYLSITDIYVQPSRTEALSIAACEAMSLGVPIVATNIGGLPELTTQLFEVGDSKALATILNELISNPNKRKRLGQKSFEEFNYKFKEERGIEEYSKLYSL
jgi:hypothetical protein